ncbi:MAG: hypothetical protein IIB42_10605, partial [Candidatus Marinimicrobia bacterium]|nr:hypothetical protein [Candidatus Neomarinimicrobiota bacterium]
MFVLTVLFGLTACFSLASVGELKASNRYFDSADAFWTAETAINRFIANPTMLDQGDLTLNIGGVSVDLSKDDVTDPRTRVLTATATANGVKRAISVSFPAVVSDIYSNTLSSGGNAAINGFFGTMNYDGQSRLSGTYQPAHGAVSITFDDLQEGVASEAASLAGTLRLGKLVYLYDDNDISIEGNTDIAFAENVAQRFQAYGWHVVGPIDGMDAGFVDTALRLARRETDRPSLIICRTTIGYGSPNKAGTASAHGEPLGEEEVRLTRERLGWPCDVPFETPPEALSHFRLARERGKRLQEEWEALFEKYSQAYPQQAQQLEEALDGGLPQGWDQGLGELFKDQDGPLATRDASGSVMNVIADRVHAFTGGSADLAPSTKTTLKEHTCYGFQEHCSHNMHFGVREHAMGAIANGMALHGGTIPYTATFLIFSDYMRPPMRLAALMGLRVVYIFTHDSIGLGEDGPTHQPIEQLVGLRSVPDLAVLRPADATETVEAWRIAMERRHGPTVLVLSRQNLPVLDRAALAPASGLQSGGYVLWEASAQP